MGLDPRPQGTRGGQEELVTSEGNHGLCDHSPRACVSYRLPGASQRP